MENIRWEEGSGAAEYKTGINVGHEDIQWKEGARAE